MDTLFLVCAVAGGTILGLQTAMLVFGIGGDLDGDVPDGDLDIGEDSSGSSTFLKMLSLKALVAFATFFGLFGMLGQAFEVGPILTLLTGGVAGLAAMFFVAWMMSFLASLQSSGNYDLSDALGAEGRVALRVPGSMQGRGKVTVDFGGRRVECDALTSGSTLATGTLIRVVSVRGPRTVEVQLLD